MGTGELFAGSNHPEGS